MTIPGWGRKVLLLAIIPVPLDMVDVVTNTGNHSHEVYKCSLFHTETRGGGGGGFQTRKYTVLRDVCIS